MSIKVASSKLTLRAGTVGQLVELLGQNDIDVLAVTGEDAIAVESLPPVAGHKDPFDRLIAAQCLLQGMTLVSSDAAFDAHSVRRVW